MGGTQDLGNWSAYVDHLDVPVQCQLTNAVSQLKFSPAPTQSQAYQMAGFRMLAAACFDGSFFVFRVDHMDDGVTPRPSTVTQIAQQNAQAPILGICWQADTVALLLACADNQIKKFNPQT